MVSVGVDKGKPYAPPMSMQTPANMETSLKIHPNSKSEPPQDSGMSSLLYT